MKLISNSQSNTSPYLEANQLQVKPYERIPAIFKPFVGKTPAQFFEKFIGREKVECLAGAMSGFIDLGIIVPEFAKESSIQFWKYYIGDKPLDPSKSAEDSRPPFLEIKASKSLKNHLRGL